MEHAQYLSRSRFAAAQGWSPSYVTKLGHQKRLVMTPDAKMVDVQATLILLKKTQDPSKEHITSLHADGRTQRVLGSMTAPDSPLDTAPDALADGPSSRAADPKYWEGKSRRENALAQLAELELQKAHGHLVDRERVESAAYASSRMLRDAVLGLPTRLAPELSTMTDAFQIETTLRAALRQVLEDAAKIAIDDLKLVMQAH